MAADPENTIVMTLETGPVTIKLRPDLAPGHVARIKELAREGFYDGVVFHRVIPGFMAQGGDPTGTGMGGSKKANLPAEFGFEERAMEQTPRTCGSRLNSAVRFGLSEPPEPVPVGSPPWAMKPGITRWKTTPS